MSARVEHRAARRSLAANVRAAYNQGRRDAQLQVDRVLQELESKRAELAAFTGLLCRVHVAGPRYRFSQYDPQASIDLSRRTAIEVVLHDDVVRCAPKDLVVELVVQQVLEQLKRAGLAR